MAVVYYKVYYPDPANPNFIREVMERRNIKDWGDAAWAARDEYGKKVVEIRKFVTDLYKSDLISRGVNSILISGRTGEYFSFVPGGIQLSSRTRGEEVVEQKISEFEKQLAERGFRFKQINDLVDRLEEV